MTKLEIIKDMLADKYDPIDIMEYLVDHDLVSVYDILDAFEDKLMLVEEFTENFEEEEDI